jgi:exodeoxyribonuclease V gamma subunit
MALQIYTAADQLLLAEKLAYVEQNNTNLFLKHFVVTGHSSTNDFLVQVMAEKNGIAANIAFQRPNQLVEMVYAILEAGPKFKERLNGAQLVWVIDGILSDVVFLSQTEFLKIKEYIDTDMQKRFALAEKIAALFQSYQEELPAMIETWNKGGIYDKLEVKLSEDEIWQRKIWLELTSQIGDQLPDLTKVYTAIQTALLDEEKQKVLAEKLPYISFFGHLPYTKELLDFLQLLSKHCQVSIFQVAFQNDGSNRIVQNFGKLIQSQQDLMRDLPTENLLEEPKTPQDMLGALQQKIKGFQSDWNRMDDSVTVSNNFKISREVEALYHYLVRQFEINPSLSKRDICVVTPAIEQYAPAIQAFFSNKEFEIDCTFYDTSHKVHASPYTAIEALLQLEGDQFTSKKVMSLLEFNYIREKFGFSEDLDTLFQAVSLANIRHGMEGDATIETAYVSWRYGLKRLVLGFCLPPQQDQVTIAGSTFFPVDEFEETATLEIIRLHQFVEGLHSWLSEREQDKTLKEWVTFIENDTIDSFIDFKELETNKFRRVLGELLEVESFYPQKVSYKTMRYYLINALGSLESGERKGFGGVRFVAPNPYLSSPVKIYAFLGMNGRDFPRQQHRLSFDLRGEKGISQADLDKNLFLNLLVSAEEKVYFSFIGQSVKDNSSIPPSTLIDELIDNLKSIIPDLDTEKFILKHPLHAFSNKYNRDENSPLILFQNNQQKELLKTQLLDTGATLSCLDLPLENGKKVIHLHELIRFVEDPVRHYFNKVLGIYYGDDSNELAETELFELDILQNWSLKDKIAGAVINNQSPNELVEKLKMKGELPLSAIGAKLFDLNKIEMEKVLANETFQELIANQNPIAMKGEKIIGEYVIKGSVNGIYGNTLLFQTVSSNKPKYQIRALMNFYFAHSFDENVNNLFYLAKNKAKSVEIEDVTIGLEECCKLFERGTSELMAFSAELADLSLTNCSESEDSHFPISLNTRINNQLGNGFGSVYPSDYFRKIAENNGFRDHSKASSFLLMHEKVTEFITPLR